MIEANDLVRIYHLGDAVIRALDGVSLRIDNGEMVAIRGPSGSGKTTLMNVLGCLERPDSGRYNLEGHDVSRLPSDRLAEIRNTRIGFVFQTFNLLPRMTAPTPMMIPSTARIDRSLLAARLLRATLTMSQKYTARPPARRPPAPAPAAPRSAHRAGRSRAGSGPRRRCRA